jgi:guanosine-3',5'-bis(diphosphate) 3'-pyrophosphohydrolase
MYKLAKIDLLDTYIFADFFDEDAYTFVEKNPNLEVILLQAILSFKHFNPSFKTYQEWKEQAEDGAYEMEIFDENSKSIFRGSMILLSSAVESALSLAYKYHKGQIRKGDGKQYIVHLLEISKILFRLRFDAEIIAASLCHDLLEDTECPPEEIEEWCGPEVLRIVQAVSNDPELEAKEDWEKKKLKYIESVKNGGEKAIAVCIADKIVNMRSLLKIYKVQGEATWKNFNRGKEKKLWFEKKVLAMAKENWDNSLIPTYEQLIQELETTTP